MLTRRMLSSAKRFAGLLLKALHGLDSALIILARGFGTTIADTRTRYGVFLFVYTVIYALALLYIPFLPLLVLGVGYVGVLAVGRAWVRNEKQRAAIAKKLTDDDPDALPDLRGLALLSAMQLLVLFPMIFWQAQRNFQLYDTAGQASFWTWIPFTFDSFCKGMFDWSEIYEVHFTNVSPASAWGRHLLLLKRLTVDFMLIQGAIRIIAIRTTIREAVEAVERDPDLAVRVGQRSVPHLIEKLKNQDAGTRASAAIALGTLDDRRAIEPLIEALQGDKSALAVITLGKLGDARAVQPLIETVTHPSVWVRKCAAEALGQIGDVRALEPLTRLSERDDNEHVRKAAGAALEKIQPQVKTAEKQAG